MSTKTDTRQSAYERVNAAILAAIDNGVVPWRQPWQTYSQRNATTGRNYRGVNVFILAASAEENGFTDHRWMTYKQAQQIGAQVRKGSTSTPIVFGKPTTWTQAGTDEQGNESEVTRGAFVWRVYHVFNVEQCDGVTFATQEERNPEEIPSAADIWDNYRGRPTVCHGGSRAFYRPLTDEIRMPPRESFTTSADYYATLFHEGAHSTGHKSRLGRLASVDDLPTFGSANYAREELVAEMAAAFLMGVANLDQPEVINNQAAYLAGWRKKISEDPRLLITAAAQAQKAADHILGVTLAPEKSDEWVNVLTTA